MNSSSNLISTPNASHANNLELLSFIAGNQYDYQTDLFHSVLTEPAVVEPAAQIASSLKLIESVSSKPHEMSISMMTVLRLIKNLPPNQNFKLYFDNRFSSED